MQRFMKQSFVFIFFLLILTACGDKDAEEEDVNLSENEEENIEESDDEDSADQEAEEREKEEKRKEKEEEERKKREEAEREDDDSDDDHKDSGDFGKFTGDESTSKEQEDHEALEATDDDLEIVQDDDVTKDEDLNLKEIHGTASESKDGFEYDKEHGYHILHLQVGLTNYTSSNVFKEKWIAFALPNGVSVPDVDEVPSGIVIVTLPDGHEGVAVKIPTIDGIDSETLFLELPLIGEPDDNDPNNNLYLYNADGNEHSSQLIGEINSQRDIDFTQLEEK